MSILITKDIFVKDEYGVKRRVWVAGQEVESYVYKSVLSTNKTVNPEDLPIKSEEEKPTLHVNGMETKQLVEETSTLDEETVKPVKKINKKKGK